MSVSSSEVSLDGNAVVVEEPVVACLTSDDDTVTDGTDLVNVLLMVVLVVRSDTLLNDVMLFDLSVVELAESSTVCDSNKKKKEEENSHVRW